jgi:hypothetical protein
MINLPPDFPRDRYEYRTAKLPDGGTELCVWDKITGKSVMLHNEPGYLYDRASAQDAREYMSMLAAEWMREQAQHALTKSEAIEAYIAMRDAEKTPACPPLEMPDKRQHAARRIYAQVAMWRAHPDKYVDGPQDLPVPTHLGMGDGDSCPFRAEWMASGCNTVHWDRGDYVLKLALFAVHVLKAPWPDAEPIIARDIDATVSYSGLFK